MVKMTVPKFARLLQTQVADTAAAGLIHNFNVGEFNLFCDLLAENYKGAYVEVPPTMSSSAVAAELENLSNINMPSGELRSFFDEQIRHLRSAGVGMFRFDPVPSNT